MSPKAPRFESDEAQDLVARIACYCGRRDEAPNVEVGRQIAKTGNADAVSALVGLLDDSKAASSAISTLYQCGYEAPDILAPHAGVFLSLLGSRSNRLVWGAMIAISCIAKTAPDVIWRRRSEVVAAFEKGSVITRDSTIFTLAALAASSENRARSLAPWFGDAFAKCKPKFLPSWAEQVLPALGQKCGSKLIAILKKRTGEMTSASSKRRLERLLAKEDHK